MTEQQGTFPWRLPEPGEQSLFDELAELVPSKRRAEYFRVLAHMQTLGPNDEMLRILQAMGILTLLTRQAPAEIANERRQLEELLRSTLAHVDEVDARMHGYVDKLGSRISHLPKDLEAGLDPLHIAKTLGESLRQQLAQSGLSGTAQGLTNICAQMTETQKLLIAELEKLRNPTTGVVASVARANESLIAALETRSRRVDRLLDYIERHLARVWLPTVAFAALLIGIVFGIELERRFLQDGTRNTPAAMETPQAQQPSVLQPNRPKFAHRKPEE
jgi:hypothetical protein